MPWKDIEKRRAYDRARNTGERREQARAAIREWCAANPDRAKAARARYGATPAGKASAARAQAKQEAKPERQARKRETVAAYRLTPAGQASARRSEAKEARKANKRAAVSARRARLVDQLDEVVHIDVLGDRDSWRCGICAESVDRDLRHPDPMSKSHDHVLPLSKGGRHSYANAQLAHLTCNQKKSDRIQRGAA